MGKQMTYWLFIGMFQGIVDVKRIFHKEKEAIQAFDSYTGENYEELTADAEKYHDFHQYNDKYGGTFIEEIEVEP